jgi:phosphate transport system substrate-binding protein
MDVFIRRNDTRACTSPGFAISGAAVFLAIMIACGGEQRGTEKAVQESAATLTAAAASGGADLTGAGSTFAYPLYSKWAGDYDSKTGVKINYQSIGSGGGIRQFSEQTVDFGGTDAPMTDEEIAKATGGAVLHVPTAMGADVVMYNLSVVTQPLKMTPDVIADIYMGKITKWNDPRLTALNPGVALPNQDVVVVHRSDGSGTTYVWTDYLTTVNPDWATSVGRGKDVKWPVGIGGKGNEGVAGQVKQLPGAIGYVELAYAVQNASPVALIRNSAGQYVAPSVASITAAAAGVASGLSANTDYRISIINAPGHDAYPISSMTWVILYRNQSDPAKGKKLVDFLRWGLSDGQKLESALNYAPLPDAMLAPLRARLDLITYGAAH